MRVSGGAVVSADESARSSAWDRTDALLLLLLLAIAAAPRLLPWRHWFFNVDEVFQLYTIGQPTFRQAFSTWPPMGPQEPVVDYLLCFLAARLTTDVRWLRLLPLGFGFASIAAAYAFGRRLHSRRFGWFWGVLLALSMAHVFASHMLRWYSLALLLTAASVYYADATIRGGRAWKYALVALLYQLSYPYALLVGLSTLAYAAAFRRDALRRLALGLAPSWIALAACYAPLARHVMTDSAGLFGGNPFQLGAFLHRVGLGFSQESGPILALSLLLAAAGCAAALRRRDTRSSCGLALAVLSLTLLGVAGTTWLTGHLILIIHPLPLLPLFLALVAAGATALASAAPRWLDAAAVAITIAWAAASKNGLVYLAETARRSTETVAAAAAALRAPGAGPRAIVFSNPNLATHLLYELDREAFFRVEGVQYRRGFGLFRLPRELRLGDGTAVAALCDMDPSLATLDAAAFGRLVERTGSDRVRLVHLPYNYVALDRPFASLGLGPESLAPEVEGVYRLETRPSAPIVRRIPLRVFERPEALAPGARIRATLTGGAAFDATVRSVEKDAVVVEVAPR